VTPTRTYRTDKLLAALLGYRSGLPPLEFDSGMDGGTARARSRDRIVAVHSTLARRRLRAVPGRRFS
jgi:hypothetical protein